MKLNIDRMNGILYYIVNYQKMTDDGILEKMPVQQLIDSPGNGSSPADVRYTIKQLYDDGYISVEHNDKGIIEHILDITRKGHDYYQNNGLDKL